MPSQTYEYFMSFFRVALYQTLFPILIFTSLIVVFRYLATLDFVTWSLRSLDGHPFGATVQVILRQLYSAVSLTLSC